MRCQYCNCAESKVIDSRPTEEGNSIRRRRECMGCGRRFTTYEKIEMLPLMVVKRDGRRETFDAQKIKAGILHACEKLPVSMQQIDAMTTSIEQRAYVCGGGNYHAPAQRVGDFLAGHASTASGRVQPTYRPGVTWCDLHDVLPQRITATLAQALPVFGQKLRGFDDPDAVLTAPETRSSSPVRIVRGEDCQSELRGLYPCGEGAGYAGGILSAAVDGMRCAEAVLSQTEDKT